MKILIFGFTYYNYSKSMYEAIKSLGYDVKLIYDPLNYEKDNLNLVKKEVFDYAPDIFINFCGNYGHDVIDKTLLNNLREVVKIYIAADKLSRFSHIEQHIDMYDYVYVFEPSDKNILEKQYSNVKINIMEVGADEKIYASNLNTVLKEYDIVFAGGFDSKRLEFFEHIAKYSYNNSLKMALYGSFWKNKNLITTLFYKTIFKYRYPYIYKYAINESLNPEELSNLYKKTRICINCHIGIHEGLNFRVFEIMGNNNFCLCDYKEISKKYGLLDGVNIAFYKSTKDCIEKIEYYLQNEQKRKDISLCGGEYVRTNYLMRHVMNRIFMKVLNKSN